MPETIGYNRNKKIERRLSKETEGRLNHAIERLLLGQQYRQKEREAKWSDAYDMYMDEKFRGNPEDPTADVVSVNIVFSTLNTLLPFVADEDPKFLVEPHSGDSNPQAAALLEQFLNRLWQSSEMRGQTHLADAVFDWLLYGDGYVKVGYEIKMKEIYDSLGEAVKNRVNVADFMVERVNPWDIWIDPYSDGIHNARWLCQRIVMPREELINDPRYRVKKDEDVPAGVDHSNMSPEDRLRLDDVTTDDWVTIYEFYDLRDKWMMAFTMDSTQALRYIEHIQCPIIQIENYRIPNSPYHMGEVEMVSSLQFELNKTRSQMITHRRRNIGKWVIRKHALNDDAEEAMKSGVTNDVIAIEAPEPLDYLIDYLAPQPLSQDSYALDGVIRNDINEITGVNEYLRGTPGNISRTATEASILEGATNIRTRHKLIQVERAARDTGQLLLDVIRDVLPLTDFQEVRQYITGREADKVNRILGGDMNTDLIFNPDSEMFQGRYEVSVERGSTELRNPMVKAQKYMQIVQLMLGAFPILQQMQIPFNMRRMLELWFEAEGIEDVDSLFVIDEQQAMMQELLLMQQAAGATPQGSGRGGGGGGTPAGQPRPQTTNPPKEMVNPSNSGMVPSRY